MAQQIRMKACLILLATTYSVENGASNRSTGVFNIDSLLKLALVFLYSTENGASNRIQVMFSFEQSLNYYDAMITNLLH
jgi:hypothetical protein